MIVIVYLISPFWGCFMCIKWHSWESDVIVSTTHSSELLQHVERRFVELLWVSSFTQEVSLCISLSFHINEIKMNEYTFPVKIMFQKGLTQKSGTSYAHIYCYLKQAFPTSQARNLEVVSLCQSVPQRLKTSQKQYYITEHFISSRRRALAFFWNQCSSRELQNLMKCL